MDEMMVEAYVLRQTEIAAGRQIAEQVTPRHAVV